MRIEWDDEMLQQALKDLQKNMPDEVAECMSKACAAVEAEAKARCPVDSGELRRSITFDVKQDTDETKGIVGTTIDYAPYVHEGTGIYAKAGNGRKDVPWYYYSEKDGKLHRTYGNHPQPFLEEAVEAKKQEIITYFMGLIKK